MSIIESAELAAKRILVTGATGMIGANLTHQLVAIGSRPWAFVRRSSDLVRLAPLGDKVRYIVGDLRTAESIGAAVREVEPEVVSHLASSFFNPPVLGAAQHFETNVMGTIHLLDALKDRPGVRVVFAGSAAAYAGGTRLGEDARMEPSSMFGASKAASTILGQTYARLYGLEFVELRFFASFGPWERARRLVPHVILSALAREPVEITDGGQQRDFVYVSDTVDALVRAAVRPLKPGLLINVASGVGSPVRAIAERILDAMGNPVPLRVRARETRPDEIWEVSGDVSAASQHLGWRPRIGLEEGLRRSIAWFTENRGMAQLLP
jgi:nucleoside-diphosphate-sugar epimerase